MRLLVFAILSVLLGTSCGDDQAVPPVEPGIYVEEQDDDDRSRMIWQQPGAVMDAMGDFREKVIADIGAGRGFFAERLAPIADRVIAVEIDTNAIKYLDTLRRFGLQQEYRSRLEPRLTTRDNPGLERSEVDIILVVNTFMFIDNKVDYLRKIYPALRSDGRIIIVDWKKKDTPKGPTKSERLALGTLQDMLKDAGFHLVSSDDETLSYQYIIVADKKKPE